MPRNCACRRGGKTPHFNTGPNPQYTGLHRKKRTMMDKWVERGDRVHPIVDLTAETSDEEKRPAKRAKKDGGVLNLRGQPRYNPAVMELYRVIEQLEERLAAEPSGTKAHTELQRQLTMLGREMERLKDAERERNEGSARAPAEVPRLADLMEDPWSDEEGGALRPLPSTNETGLRGQPAQNPLITETLEQVIELEDQLQRVRARMRTTDPNAKEYEELHRSWMTLNQRIDNLRRQAGDAMMTNYQRNTDDRRRISASSDSSEDARWRHRMEDLDADMEADDVFGSGLKKKRGSRNCVCDHKPLHALLKSGTRKRKRGGGGAEDELAMAVERDRLAEIDRAEAKRLMADAERAKRSSLSKSMGHKASLKQLSTNLLKSGSVALRRSKKGAARGGWSDGGTYCR